MLLPRPFEADFPVLPARPQIMVGFIAWRLGPGARAIRQLRFPDRTSTSELPTTRPESGLPISGRFWRPESTSLVWRPTVQMDRSVVMDSRMGVRYPSVWKPKWKSRIRPKIS